MEKTNREWLLDQNWYDLLCKMSRRLKEREESEDACILNIVTGGFIQCWHDTSCEECIQKWLNAKRGGTIR